MTNDTCTVPDCTKGVRSKNSPHCNMHYFRIYRTGSAGEAKPRKRASKAQHCEVQGCEKPDDDAGLCHMHSARLRRHGDVSTVITRAYAKGEQHAHWAGSDITYAGAHTRLALTKGKARHHECADCNKQAAHWSYDHSDPNELVAVGLSANPIAYSADPNHYVPRCVPCHKLFDLGRVDAMRLAA